MNCKQQSLLRLFVCLFVCLLHETHMEKDKTWKVRQVVMALKTLQFKLNIFSVTLEYSLTLYVLS